MGTFEAVVFDLYGTLIYLATQLRPYHTLFATLGLTASDELKHARKIAFTHDFSNLKDLAKYIKPDVQIYFASYEKIVHEEVISATLYPETLQVLRELIKLHRKVGLISNLASPYKQPFINLGLMEYFDVVLFSCDVGLAKPEPALYQKMCNELNMDPSKILMVGDSVQNDVAGPKAIGMSAIHLDRGSVSQTSIHTLTKVLDLL